VIAVAASITDDSHQTHCIAIDQRCFGFEFILAGERRSSNHIADGKQSGCEEAG
jgi:hypothetical protein